MDESISGHSAAPADIAPVSVDDTPVAPAGVSMPDRPKELRAEDYGRDKRNVTQDDGSLGFFDSIRYALIKAGDATSEIAWWAWFGIKCIAVLTEIKQYYKGQQMKLNINTVTNVIGFVGGALVALVPLLQNQGV